jgi:hypothetical protein
MPPPSLFFYFLFGSSGPTPLMQAQTWLSQMTCVVAFPSGIIVMSFLCPDNNLCRSTCIQDAFYQPQTTWRLPEIIPVGFFLGFWLQYSCYNDAVVFFPKEGAASSSYKDCMRSAI